MLKNNFTVEGDKLDGSYLAGIVTNSVSFVSFEDIAIYGF